MPHARAVGDPWWPDAQRGAQPPPIRRNNRLQTRPNPRLFPKPFDLSLHPGGRKQKTGRREGQASISDQAACRQKTGPGRGGRASKTWEFPAPRSYMGQRLNPGGWKPKARHLPAETAPTIPMVQGFLCRLADEPKKALLPWEGTGIRPKGDITQPLPFRRGERGITLGDSTTPLAPGFNVKVRKRAQKKPSCLFDGTQPRAPRTAGFRAGRFADPLRGKDHGAGHRVGTSRPDVIPKTGTAAADESGANSPGGFMRRGFLPRWRVTRTPTPK